MLKLATAAPDFCGILDDGSRFALSEVSGLIVLYFFPRAFSPW